MQGSPRTKDAKRPETLRSWTMSRVRSTDTSPELAVRKAAHAVGLRFRLYRSDLPGTPDLVFKRWKTALFVHGCFWHSHANCSRARIPKTNQAYWIPKLERNNRRDEIVAEALAHQGWRHVVIWECETKDAMTLQRLVKERVVGGVRGEMVRSPRAQRRR